MKLTMRKLLMMLILLTLLMHPASAQKWERHELYSDAVPSDEGIHEFFSGLLGDAEKCLESFLYEDGEAVTLSKSFSNTVMLTSEEIRFYSMKGVESNASLVISPFLSMSFGVEKLTQSQATFLSSMETFAEGKGSYSTYLSARSALTNMRIALEEINRSVSEIESISLWNGSSEIYFDVSGMKNRIKEVRGLISYYEELLAEYEGEFVAEGIVVVVSDNHPFLYQEIEIHVIAVNVTPTALFIDGIEHSPEGNVVRYSFEELGTHTVYAEGVKNGKVYRSNTVKIHVIKIPTHIILSAERVSLLNEDVKVEGFISDFYGKPLNVNVSVSIDGNERILHAENGFFSVSVTRDSEGFVNVNAHYPGNETYGESESSISVFFSRFPVTIYIEANRTEIGPNGSVEFGGEIHGVDYPVNIEIFRNSSKVMTLSTSGNFTFTLSFPDRGKYSVFAFFAGDSLYKPAKSNEITVTVIAAEYPAYGKVLSVRFSDLTTSHIVLMAAIITLILLVWFALRQRKGEEHRVAETEVDDEEDNEAPAPAEMRVLPDDISESYRLLFNELIQKYGLKKSLTPRELLSSLKKEQFYEKLKIVTELHEKAVYGEVELDVEEKGVYIRLISEILEGFA